MKINVSKKIGKSTLSFQIEADKQLDALAAASFYTTMPDVCGNCKSDDVELSSNKAKEFTFVKIKCNKCNYRSNYGQYKDGSGGFFKEWEEYVRPEEKKDE